MNHSGRLLVMILPAFWMLGCASTASVPKALVDQARPGTALDAFDRKVNVAMATDAIRLAPHPEGLSPAQQDALNDLLDRWTEDATGEFFVQIPGGEGAKVVGNQVRAFLLDQGLPPTAVRTSRYEAAGNDAAPIVVGFKRYEASVPACGQVWENLTATGTNKPFANFGCAVSANMAHQVADPRDLIRPRTLGPADTGRRSVVLGKYRAGETTSTVADGQADGKVSSVK